MLESMAAGLPIVASHLPAHENLLQDGNTGFLVADESRFAHAIATLEIAEVNAKIGNAARAHARTEFGTWDDCAQRYATIYALLNQQMT